MAVLVEEISVVVRIDRIEQKVRGGWTRFVRLVPNGTLCRDEELARVGFMAPADVQAFVDRLALQGLTFYEGGVALDLVVVDQHQGPTCPCPWIEHRYLTVFEGDYTIAIGRLVGSRDTRVALPQGWTYERSLSRQHQFVANKDVADRLQPLRREQNTDVFLDRVTGKTVYVERTTPGR